MNTPENPSRNNLDQLCKEFGASLPEGARVLDAGSATAPYKHHFAQCKFQTADISGVVTFKCSLTSIPVPDNAFDAILCTQVLEHVVEPDKVLAELFRVLKPGGRILLTTPFFYEEHLIPYDYYRFTSFGLTMLMERAGFKVEATRWLEGYSCTIYYMMTTLLAQMEKLGEADHINLLRPEVERLQEAFLNREIENPIYDVGFPKNHVYQCIKPKRVPATVRTIDRIISERLTYLGPDALNVVSACIESVDIGKLPGDLCEFGVALGGSGILMASQLSDQRRFFGFDVFDTIPPPSERDDPESQIRYKTIASGDSKGIRGDLYYGYRGDLLPTVTKSFEDFGIPMEGGRINLVKGLFDQTFPEIRGLDRIAVAHIDCDWYDPVAFCLEATASRMFSGGYIIIDDFNAWGGARRATLDFLRRNEDFSIIQARPTAVLKRMRGAPDQKV